MSLRVAVIGAGHIGTRHLIAYKSCPEAELIGVCDLIPEKARATAEEFGCEGYTSVADLLAKSGVQAVSVATAGALNGSHHFGPSMQCLNAGVHVLCEKPLSNQLAEARAMVAKAEQNGLLLGCDLNHRFTPQAELAKKWVDEGKLGQVLLANVTLWIDNPNDRNPWFHIRALHPHSLDVMRYYCGKAVKVHAFFNRAPKAGSPDGKRACWSNVQTNVLFENGAIGHLTGSYDANPALNLERCEVLGTEGRFVIDNCYQNLTLYPRRSEEITMMPNPIFGGIKEFDETITRRVHHWVKQLNAGVSAKELDANGRDALAVQEIIEAAIQSWEHDRVVDIENG